MTSNLRRILTVAASLMLVAGCAGPPNSSPSSADVSAPTSASTSPTSATATATAPDPEANPTSTAPVSTVGLKPAAVLPGTKKACRNGNPLANVYHPNRLQVVAACSTVAGTVKSIRHEDDGDYHIDLAVDTAYRQMLDAGNQTYQHGWLVLELVPADQSGCTVGQPPRPTSGTYNYGICTGADEVPPSVGQHIWVTGPYVIDHWHNWAEIHPIWAMTTTKPTGSTPVTAAPAPTKTTAPTTTTTSHLTCAASMTNAAPTRYSTTTVIVKTGNAGSQVSATAQYKSTSTTHTATAGSSGVAQIPFKISRATLGYQVEVTVSVTAGSSSATCSTSFTPTA